MRTVRELERFLKRYLPHCSVETESTGELIVRTGLTGENGTLEDMAADGADIPPERPIFGQYKRE